MVKTTGNPIGEPASSKRKKTEDDESASGSTSKKQRTRVSAIAKYHALTKVPELCKAYTPGKSDHDLNARIARLEHIIEMALPQFCHSSSSNSQTDRDDDGRSQNDDEPMATGGLFQSGKWYGNSASGSIAPGPVIEQLQHAVMQKVISPEQAHSLHSDIDKPKGIDPLEPSAADNLKTLVQECGVSPHKIPELLQELPPLRTSDVLINYYFSAINWTRYVISEKDFRAAYKSVCAHGAHGVGATNPNDIRFLPLLFVVLAIAVRLAPEEVAGDARSRRVTSLRYYWSSRRSLLIAAAIQPDSLDIVLTRLLSARFLTFDRRITECWSQLGAAVRTAEALGLHRDGATMGMDAQQVEYRRRIWSYLYHADRSYALVLGRPNSIQDDYTSTLPPSNLDEDSPNAYSQPPLPLSSPTIMTFCILRHQLAGIMGRIVHHFQKVRPGRSPNNPYSEVIALDDELLKFVTNLPPHYSLEPDMSLDEKHPFIPVHRYLLITETLFVRTNLHRPYILRKLQSDRYSRSRTACFESAIKDFQVRQAFRERTSTEARIALSNAYREFQTAMISGMYLVMYPNGKDSQTMHNIVDTFMKDHEGIREMDETTLRELKVIELLKAKAIERGRPDEQVIVDEHNGIQENPAQLLLGFQQQIADAVGSASLSGSKPPLTSLSTLAHPFPALTNDNVPPVQTSPVMQRLQQSAAEYSPATSGGSPAADEDSTAQMIFNLVSNPMSEGLNSSMQWNNGTGTDFSWTSTEVPAQIGTQDPRLLPMDGAEWNYYWEALVNQIPRGQ
ncbi:nucleus protein [Moniliophthora roreri]|uniref:Xylanolytic transcriptional activator regulatory domain-containing protein n=1 Tax=Moniliophthora roreri TaxID=221103 RepID=A0A0W0FJY3_MONRR|nr:nucleus protein [Moniliophthora roreri]